MKNIVSVARALDGVEALAERFKQGKVATKPTLVEMNNQLHKAVEVAGSSDLSNTRASYVAAKVEVGKQFGADFGLYEAKLGKMEAAIEVFNKRASDITEEITTWSFDQCTFVKLPKDRPDPEVLAAARGIEAAWKQFGNLKSTAEELAIHQAHQPAIIKNKAAEVIKKFSDGVYFDNLKKARIQLAHCSLVSCIFQSPNPEDVAVWPGLTNKMLKYCTKDLGVQVNDLDKEFAMKLAAVAQAASASSASASGAMTAAKSKPGQPSSGSDQKTKQVDTMSQASTSASSVAATPTGNGNTSKFRRKS